MGQKSTRPAPDPDGIGDARPIGLTEAGPETWAMVAATADDLHERDLAKKLLAADQALRQAAAPLREPGGDSEPFREIYAVAGMVLPSERGDGPAFVPANNSRWWRRAAVAVLVMVVLGGGGLLMIGGASGLTTLAVLVFGQDPEPAANEIPSPAPTEPAKEQPHEERGDGSTGGDAGVAAPVEPEGPSIHEAKTVQDVQPGGDAVAEATQPPRKPIPIPAKPKLVMVDGTGVLLGGIHASGPDAGVFLSAESTASDVENGRGVAHARGLGHFSEEHEREGIHMVDFVDGPATAAILGTHWDAIVLEGDWLVFKVHAGAVRLHPRKNPNADCPCDSQRILDRNKTVIVTPGGAIYNPRRHERQVPDPVWDAFLILEE